MNQRIVRLALAMIVALGLSAVARAAEDNFVPFVIPAVPNNQSLAAYPPGQPIAANSPRMQARNSHFYVGDTRVKLWAVNLTFGSCFPSHADAEQLAGRLAQAGINCVRFHHMDMNTWSKGRGIWDEKDPTKLSAEALDRLDYLIDQLARKGIYSNVNLHVSRSHTKYLGLPSVPGLEFDKLIDIFTPQLIAAQKDYARQLLHHVNAYRKVKFADDSAVAIVEISNEDSMFFWGGKTNLRTLPEPYAGILQSQFVAWLKRQYGSTDKLAAAWNKQAVPRGENMIVDGAFADMEHADKNWPLETHSGSAAKLVPSKDKGAARVEISQANATEWHIQFQQRGFKFVAGQYYSLQFQARADQDRSIQYTASQTHEPWKQLGLNGSARLTNQWQTFRGGFTASDSDDQARLSFSVGGSKIAVEFKDITLCPGGREGLLKPETLEAGNVVLFGAGQTEARQQDTYRFLAETEKAFWDGMYAYIKKDLGCKAMVTGTIVFGPLGLYGQSDMDFVDSHAYWQHPHFPGRPWDGANWTVEQSAMIDHPAGATLFRMACERLAGKPFTVTEYCHPAPNDFQAECVPEMAAFAAAQDWDGIFFFDYGAVPSGERLGSYFDVGSNPGKWGFMSAGAAVFRNSAIAPLGVGKTVALTRATDAVAVVNALASHYIKRDNNMLDVAGDSDKTIWQDMLESRLCLSLSPLPVPAGAAAKSESLTTLRWTHTTKRGSFEALGQGAYVWVGRQNVEISSAQISLANPTFAAIIITCMDGLPFEQSKKLLVAACGRCENTGMKFTADRRSVGWNWGAAPVRIQAVDATISLPGAIAAGKWQIQPLGPDGVPAGISRELQVERGQRFTIQPKDKTMWYLLTRN